MSRGEPSPFSRRTVAWLAGLIGGSFVLSLVLPGVAADLGAPTTAQQNSFSKSAVGFHALVEFLERSGIEVRRRRNSRVDDLEAGVPVLAAAPQPTKGDTDEAEGEESTKRTGAFTALLTAAVERSAPAIVVLPKWSGLPHDKNPNWLAMVSDDRSSARETLKALGEVYRVELELAPDPVEGTLQLETTWGEGYTAELTRGLLLEPVGGLTPLAWCEQGVLAGSLQDDGGAELLVVADPDLLNSHGLGRADHAALALHLLRDQFDAPRLVVDETIHGFGQSEGVLAEMMRFPLVLAVVHAALVLTLVLWAGLRRFGAPLVAEPALADGKQVLIDNTAKLLQLSGNAANCLPAYYRGCVKDVARHYHVPEGLSERELVDCLEELSEAHGYEFELRETWQRIKTLNDATRVRRDAPVQIARRLHHWREGMLHVD